LIRILGGAKARAVVFVLGLLIAASTLPSLNTESCSVQHAWTAQSGSITVTSPGYGYEWVSNRTYAINWSSSGDIGLVSIDLYYSSSWYLSIASTIPNTGGYEWTVPSSTQLGFGCQVAVTDANDSNVFGMSDNFAIIDKYVIVSSPSSVEIWQAGSQECIEWSYAWVMSVNIELYRSGTYYSTIAQSYGYWSQGYWWTIPEHHEAGSDFQIKVSSSDDPLVFDYSDFFTISSPPWIDITSPDSNSSWEAGTTQEIRWDSYETGGSLQITLLYYGGFHKRIAESTPNDCSFEWEIPPELSGTYAYQIQIADVSGVSNASDTSDYFGILSATCPWIHVFTPSGGESWYSGTCYYIYWSSSNVSEMTIELHVDGVFVSTIGTGLSIYSYCYWTPDWFQPTNTQCQIKIVDSSDGSVFDMSEYFTLVGVPRILITCPTADTSWEQGTTQVITWDSYEAGDEVHIELLYWGSYRLTLASSTSNDGSFEWDIPFNISPEWAYDAYQIRVCSVSNTSLYADSQYYFELRPSTEPWLVVLDPTSGEVVEAGGKCDVYVWGMNNLGLLAKLELYADETLISTLAECAAISSTYYWYVPIDHQPGTSYQVKATSLSNDDVFAYSEFFTISVREERIIVTHPCGDYVLPGSCLTTRWYTLSHQTSSVQIDLWAEGSSVLVIDDNAYNSGEYSWLVPSYLAPGSYQVKVASSVDADVLGFSPFFTIVMPSDLISVKSIEESCGVNSTVDIRWTSTGVGQFVMIELYGGYPEIWLATIVSNTSNDGSYEWAIPPGAYPSNCYLKITSLDKPWVFGLGYAYFDSSWVRMSTPSRGDTLQPGSTVHIEWSSNDVGSSVSIDLWCDETLVSAVASHTPNDGSFDWVVPTDLIPSYSYEMSITASNEGFGDCADYVYRLQVPAPLPAYVEVTSPNDGEILASGTVHSVAWTSFGGGGQLKIELYTASSQVLTIVASTPDDGSYDWTVPADILSGADYRIKITSTSDARVFDYSDGPFVIEGMAELQTIIVKSPEGGSIWESGTSHAITWTWSGNISCVKIELLKSGAVSQVVAENASCDGSYEWVVADALEQGGQYTIRISDLVNSGVYGVSEGVFSVAPRTVTTESEPDSLPTIISAASLVVAAIAIAIALMMARGRKGQ